MVCIYVLWHKIIDVAVISLSIDLIQVQNYSKSIDIQILSGHQSKIKLRIRHKSIIFARKCELWKRRR